MEAVHRMVKDSKDSRTALQSTTYGKREWGILIGLPSTLASFALLLVVWCSLWKHLQEVQWKECSFIYGRSYLDLTGRFFVFNLFRTLDASFGLIGYPLYISVGVWFVGY